MVHTGKKVKKQGHLAGRVATGAIEVAGETVGEKIGEKVGEKVGKQVGRLAGLHFGMPGVGGKVGKLVGGKVGEHVGKYAGKSTAKRVLGAKKEKGELDCKEQSDDDEGYQQHGIIHRHPGAIAYQQHYHQVNIINHMNGSSDQHPNYQQHYLQILDGDFTSPPNNYHRGRDGIYPATGAYNGTSFGGSGQGSRWSSGSADNWGGHPGGFSDRRPDEHGRNSGGSPEKTRGRRGNHAVSDSRNKDGGRYPTHGGDFYRPLPQPSTTYLGRGGGYSKSDAYNGAAFRGSQPRRGWDRSGAGNWGHSPGGFGEYETIDGAWGSGTTAKNTRALRASYSAPAGYNEGGGRSYNSYGGQYPPPSNYDRKYHDEHPTQHRYNNGSFGSTEQNRSRRNGARVTWGDSSGGLRGLQRTPGSGRLH